MKATIATLLFAALLPLTALAPPSVETDALTGLRFATLPAGEFTMGTSDINEALAEIPDTEHAMIDDEIPAHRVRFDRPLQIATTEVTQASWHAIMGDKPGPGSHWQRAEWKQLPVVSVSWNWVQDYLAALNQRSRQYHYRLPTEAEWEYAARAGSTALRPFNKLDMDEYAWYLHSSNDEVQPVGQLKPNAFGLYDTLGNAWEWVADWYAPDSYRNSPMLNPSGPAHGDKKVRRGGSYHCPPHLIRPGYRAADTPDTAYSVTGFRLVRERN